MKPTTHIIIFFALLAWFIAPAPAQIAALHVRGLVRDSLTHEPIPYAAVQLKGTSATGLADDKGVFDIVTREPYTHLVVSAVGYATNVRQAPRPGVWALVQLNPEGVALGEVVVGGKRAKYSKKNNPAVEFARRIRSASQGSDPTKRPAYGYRQYERITMGLNDFRADKHEAMLKRFPFLGEHIDTSELTGKPVLTLLTRRKLSNVNYNEGRRHDTVTALSNSGIDDLADAESMRRFFEDVLREVDLYSNDITLMQNRFVSPLSRIAPEFYKFFLTDTVKIGGDSCIVLSFTPHNQQMFGFTGQLYVLKDDTTMFVRRASMRLPGSANLNYVKTLVINQEFTKSPDGSRLKLVDDLAIEGEVMPGTPNIYAERRMTFADHTFSPMTVAMATTGASETVLPDATSRSEQWWQSHIPTQTTHGEDTSATLMDKLRANKVFYWGEKVLKILVNGYVGTSPNKSIFDIGPVNTFYSHNELQGSRLKFAGMTTGHLSRRWFARAYGAYGLGDHRWNYGGSVEYSFRDKEYHANEFPIHSIAAEWHDDINRLGQHFLYTNPDNVFLSLSRHPDRMITYEKLARLRYTLELPNNFSVTARADWNRQETSRLVDFVDGYGKSFSHIDASTLSVQFRYAPGEKFYQGRTYRIPINLDAPVVSLTHTIGAKGILGNNYTVNKTELGLSKRFWFSAWGYLDGIVKGAHIWSRVPFTQLLIPNANSTYIVQPETFALMEPMEFVNDSYASWDLTYWANGAILNYVPVVKKLKLREVFGFRGLWGHLSDKNNPSLHPRMIQLPYGNATQPMSATPYMEVSVGLDNIFTCLRFDYIRRLTYRNTPGASNSGFQIALHFTF